MFECLESFHMHVVFPFDPIYPYATLTIEIKGIICLISATSIQVIGASFFKILLQS